MEASEAGADRQQILQFMTTEHFTLQTARGIANAEISRRHPSHPADGHLGYRAAGTDLHGLQRYLAHRLPNATPQPA